MQPCDQYYNPELPSITFSWERWIRERVEALLSANFIWLLKSSETTDFSAVCVSSFTLQSAVRSLCLLFTRNSAVISRGGFTSDASLYCWWSSLIFSFKFTIFFRWSRKRGKEGGEKKRLGKVDFSYKLPCKTDINLKLRHCTKEISWFWQIYLDEILPPRNHSKYHQPPNNMAYTQHHRYLTKHAANNLGYENCPPTFLIWETSTEK